MKTVLLDKATLGEGISFNAIKDQCDLHSFQTTSKDEVKERIQDAEIIITNKVVIGNEETADARNLRLICVAATGYNNIDLEAAKKKNITVANVKGYSTESVAQTVFGYILNIFNSSSKYDCDIKNGLWQQSPVFTMPYHPFRELKGKKLGIIGYGNIGRRVAEIGNAFNTEILICESLHKFETNRYRIPFQDVLQRSDIITIHVPLNEQTENMIGEDELKLMKKSAVLINTARGGIVNETALYNALVEGEIAFAATDVLTEEPPRKGNILFNAPNMIITPHIAWTSTEARQQLINGIAENIVLFKNGKGQTIDLCQTE